MFINMFEKVINYFIFMNWIRFTNRLFGARIPINEPDRVQFQTNEPGACRCVYALLLWIPVTRVGMA